VRRGRLDGLRALAEAELSPALPVPVVRDARTFVPLPGFEDGSFAIPDEYFEVTGKVLEHAPAVFRRTQDGAVEVRWPPPAVPLPDGARWGVELARGEDHVVVPATRAADGDDRGVVLLHDRTLVPGSWRLSTMVRMPDAVWRGSLLPPPVGPHDLRPDLPEAWSGGALVVQGGSVRLSVLDADPPGGQVVLDGVSWQGRRSLTIRVRGEGLPNASDLVLSCGESSVAVALEPAGTDLVGTVDLRRHALSPGRWLLSVQAQGPGRRPVPVRSPGSGSEDTTTWRLHGIHLVSARPRGPRRRVAVDVLGPRQAGGRVVRRLRPNRGSG